MTDTQVQETQETQEAQKAHRNRSKPGFLERARFFVSMLSNSLKIKPRHHFSTEPVWVLGKAYNTVVSGRFGALHCTALHCTTYLPTVACTSLPY